MRLRNGFGQSLGGAPSAEISAVGAGSLEWKGARLIAANWETHGLQTGGSDPEPHGPILPSLSLPGVADVADVVDAAAAVLRCAPGSR